MKPIFGITFFFTDYASPAVRLLIRVLTIYNYSLIVIQLRLPVEGTKTVGIVLANNLIAMPYLGIALERLCFRDNQKRSADMGDTPYHTLGVSQFALHFLEWSVKKPNRVSMTEKVTSSVRAELMFLARAYHQANRREKSRILNGFCAQTGYHRKHAIRMLGEIGRKSKPPGPISHYDRPEFVDLLVRLRQTSPYQSSKQLKRLMPELLSHYEDQFGGLPKEVRNDLLQVSPATMDRLISRVKSVTP